MKQFRLFAFILAIGAMFAVSAYAQKDPSGGTGTGAAGGPNHFGLSDSCWNVFLAGLSASDAAKLTADQNTISTNQAAIEGLEHQIDSLARSGGGKRDTTNGSKIKALEAQIRPLNDANNAAQLEIGAIIKANGQLLVTVLQGCGRPNGGGRDTGKGGGKDTTHKGGGKPPEKTGRGHFGLSDSCWNVFITMISSGDASELNADQSGIAALDTQINAINKQLRSLKGGLRDSTVRQQFKALIDQKHDLMKQEDSLRRDYGKIIHNNDSLLRMVRRDCGRHGKGTAGDPGSGLKVGDIIPNPATVGSEITIPITLTADAEVTISASLIGPTGPPALTLFTGTVTAGSHNQIVSLGRLSAGAWMITIQSGGSVVSKKLMIQ